MKKILYFLLLTLLILGILILAILFGAISPVLNGFKDQYLGAIEAEIGRPVDFEEIDISVLPSMSFELKNLKILDTHPQSKPLLMIDHAAFKFKLWTAIVTLGQHIEINELMINGLHIDVYRNTEGKLSFEDITEKLAQQEATALKNTNPAQSKPSHQPTKQGLSQEEKKVLLEQLKALRLKSIGLQKASFHYADLNQPTLPAIEINEINLLLKDFSFDQPLGIELSMGLFHKTQNTTLNIDSPAIEQLMTQWKKEQDKRKSKENGADEDPTHPEELIGNNVKSKDSSFNQVALQTQKQVSDEASHQASDDHLKDENSDENDENDENDETISLQKEIDRYLEAMTQGIPLPIKISLKLKQISFNPLLPYLPKDLPLALEQFRIDSDLSLEITDTLNIVSQGFFHLSDFKLKEGQLQSQAFTIKLNPNFQVFPKEGKLALEGFRLAINKASFDINALLSDLYTEQPRVEKLKLFLDQLRLDDFSTDPILKKYLPPKAQLSGPVAFELSAQGTAEEQSLTLKLDLDQSTMIIPKQIVKKAGQIMHLKGKFKLSPQAIRIEDFLLKIQTLSFKLSGQLSQFKSPQFDFKGGTSSFEIDQVVRLLPSVEESIPATVKIDGKTELAFKLQGNLKDMNSSIKLGLSQMDLKTPELKLLGSGHVEFSVDGNVEKDIDLKLLSSLSGLELKLGEDFHKPKAVPFEIDIAMSKKGNQIKVPSFFFQLADLKLNAMVKSINQDQLSLSTQLSQAKLNSIFALLPSMKDSSIKNATLSLDLDLSTQISRINQNLTLQLNHLEFKSAKNHILGKLTFQNPKAPKITFDFNIPQLDRSEFEAQASKGKAESKSAHQGTTHTKQGSSKDQEIQIPKILYHVDLNGSFKIGHARLNDLEFKNYQSKFKGKNGKYSIQELSVDIYGGQVQSNPMSIDLKKKNILADLEVKKIKIEALSEKKDLTGNFSAAFKMNAKGLSTEKIKKTMSSQMSANLDNATLHGFDPQTLIYKALSSKIPGLKAPKPSALALKDLGMLLGIRQGKLKSNQPIKFNTEYGEMRFNLSADMSLNLTLKGTWLIPISLIEKLISKKLSRKEPIPLNIELVGNGDEFKVKDINWEPIVLIVIKEIGGKALEQGVEKAIDQLGGKKGKEVKNTAKKVLKKIF